MKKVSILTLIASAILAAGPARAAITGEAEACTSGRPSVLVRVDGFKQRTGSLRVQVYGSNPADFLAKGRKLRRVDVPVAPAGRMDICVALPGPGRYAVAVRHDLDANGRSGWSDGGGFSRNPSVSLLHLRPRFEDVVVPVGQGVRVLDVMLNYRRGLSIGPVAG